MDSEVTVTLSPLFGATTITGGVNSGLVDALYSIFFAATRGVDFALTVALSPTLWSTTWFPLVFEPAPEDGLQQSIKIVCEDLPYYNLPKLLN